MDGETVKAETMDICVRAISVGALHKAYPMTGAICTGACASIEGTLAWEMCRKTCRQGDESTVRLGHASGVTDVIVKFDGDKVLSGGVIRTARRIMDGYVYIR